MTTICCCPPITKYTVRLLVSAGTSSKLIPSISALKIMCSFVQDAGSVCTDFSVCEVVKIEVDHICPILTVQLPSWYLYFIAAFVFKLLEKMATHQGFGAFSLVHACRSETFCHRAAWN